MNKFLSEILAQPQSLSATLDFYSGEDGENILARIKELFLKEKFQQIIFTGMGSSYFVSYAACCLFNHLGINSYVWNTSELLYYHLSLLTEETLVVCISQSGESIEVVKLLEKLPAKVYCIGISNEEESTLNIKTKELLLSKAGKEEMTSTKTYTTITLVTFILGWFLSNEWGDNKKGNIIKLISDIKEQLDRYNSLVNSQLKFIGEVEFLQFIGRGPSFSTALQSELMFKEAAKISAAGTLGGEFRHGPMEMVGQGFKSILFAADGKTYKQSIKMAEDIARYGGKIILITNKDPHLTDPNIKTMEIIQPDEYLFSLQAIIPVQLMVNNLALLKGYEPGDFVHGGKVTLLE